ncbi:hypothetical protein C4D60_Mb00t19660 [Musa balbisiana]|uniref:Ubiquitin-like domain-containing protein n=1 Tax=Musa balbisiana TaxID=52838 RepID=A0A4S8I3J5_MUSBA|nr:hypothetical protein C4D60_Mb00t19660 [Musa balbisiana]
MWGRRRGGDEGRRFAVKQRGSGPRETALRRRMKKLLKADSGLKPESRSLLYKGSREETASTLSRVG